MRRVLLLGSPNSGKSSLFNRLTGLSQRVANYPGITVDVASGPMVNLPDTELVDFPGTYSLEPISGEEAIAVSFLNEALADDHVSHVLCVADATRLEKCLHFILQVIRECQHHQKPVTILANMSDVIRDNQLQFDPAGLAAALGVPVISVSAKESQGFEPLVECLAEAPHLQRPQAVIGVKPPTKFYGAQRSSWRHNSVLRAMCSSTPNSGWIGSF